MCNRVSVPDIPEVEKAFNATVENPEGYKRYYHVNTWDQPLLPTIHSDNLKLIRLDIWRTYKSGEFDTYNARNDRVFDYDYRGITEKRVLVCVNGFFEYRWVNKKSYPYFIRLKHGEPFALGGFINKFGWLSILTTDPNDTMEMIHNRSKRMPFILTKDDQNKWLSNDLMEKEILELMRPCPDEIMQYHTVNKIPQKAHLNNVATTICEYKYPELDSLLF